MRRVTQDQPITLDEIRALATTRFGDMVKGVVIGDDWLEFDSMINLRPSFGNRSRAVDDPSTREAIRNVVNQLVRR
jgi:hypothetical protein